MKILYGLHTAFERGGPLIRDFRNEDHSNDGTHLEMKCLAHGIGLDILEGVQMILRDPSIPSAELADHLQVCAETPHAELDELAPPIKSVMSTRGWVRKLMQHDNLSRSTLSQWISWSSDRTIEHFGRKRHECVMHQASKCNSILVVTSRFSGLSMLYAAALKYNNRELAETIKNAAWRKHLGVSLSIENDCAEVEWHLECFVHELPQAPVHQHIAYELV